VPRGSAPIGKAYAAKRWCPGVGPALGRISPTKRQLDGSTLTGQVRKTIARGDSYRARGGTEPQDNGRCQKGEILQLKGKTVTTTVDHGFLGIGLGGQPALLVKVGTREKSAARQTVRGAGWHLKGLNRECQLDGKNNLNGAEVRNMR